jgi:activator of 2-hydroxyglutaryl-CoA dehydratase
MDGYLGVDVGSVTAKCAIITEGGEFVAYNYLCIQGKPVSAVQQGLREVQGQLPADVRIRADMHRRQRPLSSGRYCGC